MNENTFIATVRFDVIEQKNNTYRLFSNDTPMDDITVSSLDELSLIMKQFRADMMRDLGLKVKFDVHLKMGV